jgi:two-component system LytT family response regulator
MRAVIVDDERLARNELRRLLARHPEVEVVGEAASAEAARRVIHALEPDLLFVDVQMPGETGFDLVASLDAVPLVVFATAYDEYALQAFEVSALDYLVKPIEPKRLAQSVDRLLAADRRSTGPETATAGADTGVDRLSEEDRVFVADGNRYWLIDLGRIRLFESADNYAQAFFDDRSPMIRRSLNQLEEKLDPRVFFRANRSQIINIKAIRAIHSWFGGRLMVELEGGQEVTLSRRRTRVFRELMSV